VGNISVTANILPKTMAKLCKLALDGKAGEASRLNKKLLPIHRALFVESNPVPVKWLLYRLGYIGRSIRLPLIEPSDANKVFLENIIASIRELEGED
jgi:4-hydroxy-tetrahydrodipicolinate synthase